MKKTQNVILALTALAAAGTLQLGAADAATTAAKSAASAKPAVHPAAVNAKPVAKKTIDEVFKFLPDTIATIDGKPIQKKEFMKQFAQVPVDYIAQMPEAQLKMMMKQAVDQYISKQLLTDLVSKSGIKVTKQMLMDEFEKQLKSAPKDQLELLEKQLKLQNSSIAKVKEDFAKKAENPDFQSAYALKLWVDKNIQPKVNVTDADAEKFYRENPVYFQIPETIKASHILYPNRNLSDRNAAVDPAMDKDAKAKAEKALARLKQGASFEKIAEEESACPSGKQAKGSLGEFGKGQMDPAFEKAAFALQKPKELSGVVKSSFGYHIIRLDEKKAASMKPFASVKEMIKAELKNQKIEAALMAQIEQEKKARGVKISEFK